MGERDDHSRVAIWTECQRMDTLLTEVARMPAGFRVDHSSLAVWFVAAAVLTAEMVMCRLRSEEFRFSDQRL